MNKQLILSKPRIDEKILNQISIILLEIRDIKIPTKDEVIATVNKLHNLNEDNCASGYKIKLKNIIGFIGLTGIGKKENRFIKQTLAYDKYKKKILF